MKLTDLTEKQWTGQVAELARSLGWKRYHTFRSERSPAGFPDEVFCRDRVVFAELKRELTGRKSDDRARQPSPLQVEWLDSLARAGCEVYLWRPSDLEELGRILSKRWRLDRLSGFLSGTEADTSWRPKSLWIAGAGRADRPANLPPNPGYCRHPDRCAGLNSCPRDISCID